MDDSDLDRLIARAREDQLSRRRLLRLSGGAVGLAALAPIAAACTGPGASPTAGGASPTDVLGSQVELAADPALFRDLSEVRSIIEAPRRGAGGRAPHGRRGDRAGRTRRGA